MKRKSTLTLIAAVAAAAFPCVAHAAPLVDLEVLGSSDGVHYTSNLQVTAGQTYDFEVLGELAPVTTMNNAGTITSETSGTDGIGSLSYNLTDPGSNPVQISFASQTLTGTYAQGTGASAGTPTSVGGGTNNELAGARPINPNGTNTAVGTLDTIETGTFTVPTAQYNSGSILTGSFGGVFSTIKINGGNVVSITSSTESSGDPIVSIAPLTLSVPEPSGLSLVALGSFALLSRRRSRKA